LPEEFWTSTVEAPRQHGFVSKLNNIEAHHHIGVFMFVVLIVHQIAAGIAVGSHDDADVVA